jgi:hypothetical protein
MFYLLFILMKTLNYIILVILIALLALTTINFVNSKDNYNIAQLWGQVNYEKLMDFFGTDTYKTYQTNSIDNMILQATTPAKTQ